MTNPLIAVEFAVLAEHDGLAPAWDLEHWRPRPGSRGFLQALLNAFVVQVLAPRLLRFPETRVKEWLRRHYGEFVEALLVSTRPSDGAVLFLSPRSLEVPAGSFPSVDEVVSTCARRSRTG